MKVVVMCVSGEEVGVPPAHNPAEYSAKLHIYIQPSCCRQKAVLADLNGQKQVFLCGGGYLSQGVPVGDGFPGVSQHLVPVVPAQALSVRPGPAHADHLVVSHPVGGENGPGSLTGSSTHVLVVSPQRPAHRS